MSFYKYITYFGFTTVIVSCSSVDNSNIVDLNTLTFYITTLLLICVSILSYQQIENKKQAKNGVKKPKLIGFKNGAYNVQKRKFYDYCMNTNLTYDPEYSFKNQKVKQIVTFLSNTIPNNEMCDYLLYTLGSYIFKTNTHNQKSIVIIGDTNLI